jgi:hypothetical protein
MIRYIDEFTLSLPPVHYHYFYHIKDFTKQKELNKLGKEELTQCRAQGSGPHIFPPIGILIHLSKCKPIKNPSMEIKNV